MLFDRKHTIISTASFHGVQSEAASSSYSVRKDEGTNIDDKLLTSETMSSKFESVEILKDTKNQDPFKSERLENNGLMQMIDEDSREVESSFRSQTSLMPEMYLQNEENKQIPDGQSDFSALIPNSSRSNSVWTNTNMVKEGMPNELIQSELDPSSMVHGEDLFMK